MKSFFLAAIFVFSFSVFAQDKSDQSLIETTLNNYLDAFYKGDTTKLKAAIKPRLYKFGYWKNKESGNYDYYDQMTYKKAMEFVQKMKADGNTKDENTYRAIEVLDIGKHIASAKIIGWWGIDYALLSKDDGKWMIEQVIWEGPLEKPVEKKITTYYLIRHAEKDRSDKTNKNPHLTEVGKKRAVNWSKILKDVKFDIVYSTDYNRTKETATPIAKTNDVMLSIYNPKKMDTNAFMRETKGKTVLIVGHSNTTPEFTNGLLGEKKYDMIADDNNANLYIVTITKDSKSSTVLVID